MVGNDQPIGEDAIRLRRAIQQNIIENPGMRQPVRSGEGAGVDPDTGWNYVEDGNPFEFTTDVREIRRMAIEINQAYFTGGENAVKEKLQSYRTREDYRKQREAATTTTQGNEQQPNHIRVKTDEEMLQERANAAMEDVSERLQAGEIPDKDAVMMMMHGAKNPIPTQEQQQIISETYTMSNSAVPEVKLPDDFQGIVFIDAHISSEEKDVKVSKWKQAQLQCLTRSDLDWTLPDDLEDDIKSQCHTIAIAYDEKNFVIAVSNEKKEAIYNETMPNDKYTLALKMPIITDDEENQ